MSRGLHVFYRTLQCVQHFSRVQKQFFICGDEVTDPISLPIAQSHRMGAFRIHALRYRCSIVGTPAVPFGVLSIATLTA